MALTTSNAARLGRFWRRAARRFAGGSRLRVRLEVLSFKLPGREAADVDMVFVRIAMIAALKEFDLEFNLILTDGSIADRAARAVPRTAPGAVRAAVR
jgi:hypothetical protein